MMPGEGTPNFSRGCQNRVEVEPLYGKLKFTNIYFSFTQGTAGNEKGLCQLRLDPETVALRGGIPFLKCTVCQESNTLLGKKVVKRWESRSLNHTTFDHIFY